jgi:fibronectin-binding autotransporter adhesin
MEDFRAVPTDGSFSLINDVGNLRVAPAVSGATAQASIASTDWDAVGNKWESQIARGRVSAFPFVRLNNTLTTSASVATVVLKPEVAEVLATAGRKHRERSVSDWERESLTRPPLGAQVSDLRRNAGNDATSRERGVSDPQPGIAGLRPASLGLAAASGFTTDAIENYVASFAIVVPAPPQVGAEPQAASDNLRPQLQVGDSELPVVVNGDSSSVAVASSFDVADEPPQVSIEPQATSDNLRTQSRASQYRAKGDIGQLALPTAAALPTALALAAPSLFAAADIAPFAADPAPADIWDAASTNANGSGYKWSDQKWRDAPTDTAPSPVLRAWLGGDRTTVFNLTAPADALTIGLDASITVPALSVLQGQITVSSGGGALTLSPSATLFVESAASLSLAASFSATAFTKTGAGTLFANTATASVGTLTLREGTLTIAGKATSFATVNIEGGLLRLTEATGGLAAAIGTINLSAQPGYGAIIDTNGISVQHYGAGVTVFTGFVGTITNTNPLTGIAPSSSGTFNTATWTKNTAGMLALEGVQIYTTDGRRIGLSAGIIHFAQVGSSHAGLLVDNEVAHGITITNSINIGGTGFIFYPIGSGHLTIGGYNVPDKSQGTYDPLTGLWKTAGGQPVPEIPATGTIQTTAWQASWLGSSTFTGSVTVTGAGQKLATGTPFNVTSLSLENGGAIQIGQFTSFFSNFAVGATNLTTANFNSAGGVAGDGGSLAAVPATVLTLGGGTLTLSKATGIQTIAGKLSGTGTITQSGATTTTHSYAQDYDAAGVLIANAASDFSGTLNVNAGGFINTGNFSAAAIAVNFGNATTFETSGNATLAGTVNFKGTSATFLAAAGTIGNLTFTSGNTTVVVPSATTHVSVTGLLTYSAGVITFDAYAALDGLALGESRPLLGYGSAAGLTFEADSAPFLAAANWKILGAENLRPTTFELLAADGLISVNYAEKPHYNVVFAGRAAADGTAKSSLGWKHNDATNFKVNEAGLREGQHIAFFDGDTVRFDGTLSGGIGATTVTIAGTVRPAAITVAAAGASDAYTFTGGTIADYSNDYLTFTGAAGDTIANAATAAPTTLTKTGAGELTITSTLAITGAVIVEGGTLATAQALTTLARIGVGGIGGGENTELQAASIALTGANTSFAGHLATTAKDAPDITANLALGGGHTLIIGGATAGTGVAIGATNALTSTGTIDVLSVTGVVTLNTGAALAFDISNFATDAPDATALAAGLASRMDKVDVTGNIVLSAAAGTVVIHIPALAALRKGTYELLSVTGAFTGLGDITADSDAAAYTAAGQGAFRIAGYDPAAGSAVQLWLSLANDGKTLLLNAAGVDSTLVWAGIPAAVMNTTADNAVWVGAKSGAASGYSPSEKYAFDGRDTQRTFDVAGGAFKAASVEFWSDRNGGLGNGGTGRSAYTLNFAGGFIADDADAGGVASLTLGGKRDGSGGVFTATEAVDVTFSAVAGHNAADSFTGTVTIANGSTLTLDNTANAAVPLITNGGTASLLGAGGTAAANLVLDGGTLAFKTNTAVATDRSFTIGTGGATLDSTTSGVGAQTPQITLGAADGSSPAIALAGTGARTLTLTGSGTAALNLNLALADTAAPASDFDAGKTLSLVKNGSGTWWLAGENAFSGNLTVNAGTLKITGRIGVYHETFDSATQWEATYTHTNYTGNIHIAENAIVEFAAGPNADYQRLAGNLTGGGTLKKNSEWNLYYTGNASTFTGATVVEKGSFNLNTGPAADNGKYYGAAAENNVFSGSFTVHANGILSSGGGAAIRTGSFVMDSGSTLVLNPGTFAVRATDAGSVTLPTDGTLNLRIILGSSDITGAAKLSFQGVDGVVFSGSGGGVEHPYNTNIAFSTKGYFPAPEGENGWQEFTLIEGLDYISDANAVAASKRLNITTSEQTWNDTEKAWDIQIMRSGFYVSYDSEGHLILWQYSYVHVPEPATYALSASALLLGLAFFRKRKQARQKKQKKNHR